MVRQFEEGTCRTVLSIDFVYIAMGVYADDVTEFTQSKEINEDRPPLGDRLRGLANELDIDSVEEVRRLRERT